MKILLATHNPGKIVEIKLGIQALVDKGFEIVTLDDLHIDLEPVETGKTFEENALLKAKYYSDISHLPCISDDGGPMIDALNGEPGVKSNMWLGHKVSDQELLDYTLERLKGVPFEKRTARFETCLCFYDPTDDFTIFETQDVEGYMAERPSSFKLNGYPFRAIFVVKKFNKLYDELTEEQHTEINHRRRALKKLVNKIIEHYA